MNHTGSYQSTRANPRCVPTTNGVNTRCILDACAPVVEINGGGTPETDDRELDEGETGAEDREELVGMEVFDFVSINRSTSAFVRRPE